MFYRMLHTILDVNECLNSTLNDCHEHASCNNTIGSFECFCNKGFNGNGTSCIGKRPSDWKISR